MRTLVPLIFAGVKIDSPAASASDAKVDLRS
jgi:hypothetical protein